MAMMALLFHEATGGHKQRDDACDEQDRFHTHTMSEDCAVAGSCPKKQFLHQV
jgi:hypothetical protein